jgi:hypothetical protein
MCRMPDHVKQTVFDGTKYLYGVGSRLLNWRTGPHGSKMSRGVGEEEDKFSRALRAREYLKVGVTRARRAEYL